VCDVTVYASCDYRAAAEGLVPAEEPLVRTVRHLAAAQTAQLWHISAEVQSLNALIVPFTSMCRCIECSTAWLDECDVAPQAVGYM
jgi:hypothetical protein